MTTDTKALIERLPGIAELLRRTGNGDMADWCVAAAQALRDLTAENERLKALGDELAGALRSAKGILENSGAESGYCMCGDPVASHSIESGHAPVDSHLYAVGQASECYAAALAAWENKDD